MVSESSEAAPQSQELEDLRQQLAAVKDQLEISQVEVKSLQDVLGRLVVEKSDLLEIREKYVDRVVCGTMIKQFLRCEAGERRDQILALLANFLETDFSHEALHDTDIVVPAKDEQEESERDLSVTKLTGMKSHL